MYLIKSLPLIFWYGFWSLLLLALEWFVHALMEVHEDIQDLAISVGDWYEDRFLDW